jgi:hypothetical protein
MQIVHEHSAQRQGASAHRSGGIEFLSLLKGVEGSRGNFHLALVKAKDYATPRHRHNFDQVRIMLAGSFGFDRGQEMHEGMLGYFAEGTYYTQRGAGHSTTLLLQSGGASGAGYMSDNQLRRAVAQLQERGSFADGVYTWLDSKGKKHNQDGYEAAWEHVHGRPIRYPRQHAGQPVLWHASDFAWEPTDQRGVRVRHFGQFAQQRLAVAQINIDAGALCHLSAHATETLVYVIHGQAHLGAEPLRAISAIHMLPNEQACIAAGEATQLYAMGLGHM